jgi:urea ABC transporter permease protein UrtC
MNKMSRNLIPSSVSGLASAPPAAGGQENGWTKTIRVYALPVVLLALLPLVASQYQVSLLARFLVYGLLALSLDLLWGYAGILNFGHAVFFGLGAYALALTLKYWGDVPGATYLGLILAVVVPALLALVIGWAMFFRRVSGVYFAIVTFAVGAIFYSVTIVWIEFTGGLNGLYGFPNPTLGIPGVWEVDLSAPTTAYYLIAAVLGLVFLLLRRLVHLPFGRALRAIESNESRVEFFGYEVARIKVLVFVVSCAIAGLSGALYVPVGFVTADIMGILFSTSIIVWVAVGGRGTLIGPIVGALVVNYLQAWLSDILVYYWFLLIGVFFVIVVVFWPDGIVGIAQRLAKRLRVELRGDR